MIIRRLVVAGIMVAVMAFMAVATTSASQTNSTGGITPVATTALPKEGEKPKVKKSKKQKSRAPWMRRVNGKLVVSPRSLAWHLNKKWFGKEHWWALDKLIYKESSWNPWETYGSACGLPQAKPCSKIPNWRSIKSQLVWMMKYIKGRYKNPTSALYAHYAKGWY